MCGICRTRSALRCNYAIISPFLKRAISSAGSAPYTLICPLFSAVGSPARHCIRILFLCAKIPVKISVASSAIIENGFIAQLGERQVRNLEVRGSIPLWSTKAEPDEPRGRLALLLSLQSIWSAESSFWSVRSTRKNKKEATAQDCSCAVASLCFFIAITDFVIIYQNPARF